MYRFGPALSALLLLGCAATPYQASDPNGYGYQDRQVAAGIYDVMFVGNTATSAQQVEDLALLHAAELGAAQGYDYLAISERKASIITLRGRSGHAATGMPSTMPNARDAGMSMGTGGAGGYGSTTTGPAGYTINSSSSGGEPARACVLRVHFYKQGESGSTSSQDIQALLTKLRGEYGVSIAAGGH